MSTLVDEAPALGNTPALTSQEAWEDLVATALVGTARRPHLPAGVPALAGQGPNPEERLLTAASFLAAERRVSWSPVTGVVAGPPAPTEERAPCSPEAARVLELLLADAVPLVSTGQLICHWLARAGRAGACPPAALLVPTLDWASAHLGAGGDLAWGALGERGRWLAEQEPAWAGLAPAPELDEQAWAQAWGTGTTSRRLALLHDLRRKRPDHARHVLAESWAHEPAAARATLIAALAEGLSDQDEDFLEQARTDRSQPVREQAVKLLAQLERQPGSRRGQPLAARALTLVSVTPGPRPKLVLTLPDLPGEPEPEPELGAGPEHQPRGKGKAKGPARWGQGKLTRRRSRPEQAGANRWALFHHLVSGTPLDAWGASLERTPQQLAALARHEPALVNAWAEAAVLQNEAEWAKALLAVCPSTPALPAPTALPALPALPALAGLLPAETAQAAVEHLLEGRDDLDATTVAAVLRATAAPWSGPFSRAAARWALARPGRLHLRTGLPHVLAQQLDVNVVEDLARWAAARKDDPGARKVARDLEHQLNLRRTIDQELR